MEILKTFYYVDEVGNIIDTTYKTEDDGEPNCFEGWSNDQPFFNPIWDFSSGQWIENTSAEELLQMARDKKEQELNRRCNETIMGRFSSIVNGVTYWFSNDAEAQANFDKADIAFARGRITEIAWTVYEESGTVARVLLDATIFESVYMDHLGHIQNNISRFRDILMPQVYAAATVAEVEEIIW